MRKFKKKKGAVQRRAAGTSDRPRVFAELEVEQAPAIASDPLACILVFPNGVELKLDRASVEQIRTLVGPC